MSVPERFAYLPGYVPPAERIARALQAATRMPRGGVQDQVGPDILRQAQLYVWFSLQKPTTNPNNHLHRQVPAAAVDLRRPPASWFNFADIVVTMFLKSLDWPSGADAIVSGLDPAGPGVDARRNRDAELLKKVYKWMKDLTFNRRYEQRSSFRLPNALAEAAVLAFLIIAPLGGSQLPQTLRNLRVAQNMQVRAEEVASELRQRPDRREVPRGCRASLAFMLRPQAIRGPGLPYRTCSTCRETAPGGARSCSVSWRAW